MRSVTSFILFIGMLMMRIAKNIVMSDCESTWIKFNSKCYKIFKESEYFDNADRLCQRYQARLPSIHSDTENQYLSDLVQNETSFQEAWIGYKKTENDNGLWVNNENIDYLNFMIGVLPDNSRKKCGIIIRGGKWDLITCLHLRPYVCKKDQKKPEEEDNTAFILTLTIPICCITLMIVFVLILCIHSHRELAQLNKQLPEDTKAFDIVQTTISLPLIEKPPELLVGRGKGKKLWMETFNKIKEEQSKNEKFYASPLMATKNYNNNNNISDNYLNVKLKRSESLYYDGLLGAPEVNEETVVPEVEFALQQCNENVVTTNQMKTEENSNNLSTPNVIRKASSVIRTLSFNSFFRTLSTKKKEKKNFDSEEKNVVENKYALRYMKSEPYDDNLSRGILRGNHESFKMYIKPNIDHDKLPDKSKQNGATNDIFKIHRTPEVTSNNVNIHHALINTRKHANGFNPNIALSENIQGADEYLEDLSTRKRSRTVEVTRL